MRLKVTFICTLPVLYVVYVAVWALTNTDANGWQKNLKVVLWNATVKFCFLCMS